jgi:membrane-bound serine protease (ClpP class)
MEGKALAYVIPVRDQIGAPILDILRRGLKDAIRAKATTVVLDMDTPGGELGVTLEIMQEIVESFERFEGPILTYVNSDAISAGAYIAIATNEIAFAPYGQIGAAEAVSGGGGDIDAGMKRKINSYLKAKIRNFSGEHRYRSRVMVAMMDANETLLVEGEQPVAADGSLIQKEGELLSLTAEEAIKEYGDPPQHLLGIGIYKTVDELLAAKYGEDNFEVVSMEINWAEELGLWLSGVGPLILGLGMLLLFIEFKTPGFGVFGASGLVLLLIFFGSKYVAGFAGHEEVIVFLLGASLVALEVFLFPGLVVPALLGMVMMLGSLLWAMVDVWPVPDFEWSLDLFHKPIQDLGIGLLITVVLGFVAARLLPHTPLWGHLVLGATVGGSDPVVTGGATSVDTPVELPGVGTEGETVTQLFPTGEVEIDGRRYEAQARSGTIRKGEAIRVAGHRNFNLVVTRKENT